MVVLAVVVWAVVLFWSPVIVAAIRRAEPISLVVLLCFLFWFPAWIAAFGLPRQRPVRTGRAARVTYSRAAARPPRRW
jgi:hypothetical protein